MSRRKQRSAGERDDLLTSLTEPVAPRLLVEPSYISTPDEPWTEVQDRRTFTPDTFNPAVEIGGRPARVAHRYPSPLKSLHQFQRVLRTPARKLSRAKQRLEHRLGFASPLRTLVCIRRKARKEVLFALGKRRGKGGGRRRRNSYSNVSC